MGKKGKWKELTLNLQGSNSSFPGKRGRGIRVQAARDHCSPRLLFSNFNELAPFSFRLKSSRELIREVLSHGGNENRQRSRTEKLLSESESEGVVDFT